MRRLLALVLLATATQAGPLPAQEATEGETSVHVVRPGDTLWDLARRYLGDPFRWPEIHALNREGVRDPHWIYPRNRLLLPGARSAAADESPTRAIVPVEGGADASVAAQPTVFLPISRTVEVRGGVQRTSAAEIPLVPAGAFFAAGLLVPDEELVRVGELVEVVSPTVISRSAAPQIQPYDRVHLRLSGTVAPGDRVHLLRPDRIVVPYGRMHLPTGEAVVLSVHGATATVEVDRFYGRIEIGDIAVPMPAYEARPGVVPRPASGLDGELLAFASGQPVVGTEDVAFVNLGTASGVVVGDEFEVFLPSTPAVWGARPEIVVARLQVVRAARLTSAARVIALEQPALDVGLPVRLVARMP